MNNYEQQYLDLLNKVRTNGVHSKNRTAIDTYKIWGAQIHIDLQQGFPLLTTKKMHWKSVVHELLWMIKGDTNIQYLLRNGVTFWTEWPYQVYKNTDINNLAENERGGLPPHWEHKTQKEFEQTIINNDDFAKKWGSIGEYGYGAMWRKFPVKNYFDQQEVLQYSNVGDTVATSYVNGHLHYLHFVDQLSNVINDLKTNPDSRRIIITAWHPYHSNRKEDALLPACHNYIQFGTEELSFDERLHLYYEKAGKNGTVSPSEEMMKHIPKHRLNCYFHMRSNDVPLGLPYNIAFYALFTHLVARCVNMVPSQLVYTAADVHIYENQLDGINEQLARKPGALPKLKLSNNCSTNIFDIKFEDIEIAGYAPQPHIKMPVAV